MLNYYKDFEKYLQRNGVIKTNVTLINPKDATTKLNSLDNYSNFKFSLKLYKDILKQYLQKQNPYGRLFFGKFVDNDDKIMQKVLKRWLPLYIRRKRDLKLRWFNKLRMKIKIKIMRKIRNQQEYNWLYSDYKYKDQYLNYLKMVNNLKESLNCPFQPNVNKNRTVIKYYISNGWQIGEDWNQMNKHYKDKNKEDRKIQLYDSESNKWNRSLTTIYFEPFYNSRSIYPKYHPQNTKYNINGKRYLNKSNSVKNIHNNSDKYQENLFTLRRKSLNETELFKQTSTNVNNKQRIIDKSLQCKAYKNWFYLRKDNPSYAGSKASNKISKFPHQSPPDYCCNSLDINYNSSKHPNNTSNISNQAILEKEPYTEGLITQRFNNRKKVLNISDSNTKLNEDDCYNYLLKNRNSGHYHQHKCGINTYNTLKKNHQDNINNNSSFNNNRTKEISELTKSNSLPLLNVNTSKHQKNKSSMGCNNNFNLDWNKINNTNQVNQLIVDTGHFSVPPSYPQITHVTLQTMTDAKYLDIANRYVSTDESLERFKAISTRVEQNKK